MRSLKVHFYMCIKRYRYNSVVFRRKKAFERCSRILKKKGLQRHHQCCRQWQKKTSCVQSKGEHSCEQERKR